MKRVVAFFLLIASLVTFATAENTQPVRIISTTHYYDSLQDYASSGHDMNFRFGSMNDIATALASHNPDIDVFVFATYSGLDQIKKQHYYYPLTDDAVMMAKFNDLFPEFRNALMDNGQLVGCYVDMQPWAWYVFEPDLVEEAECDQPTTFDELLDVCREMTDSGVLGNTYTMISEYDYTKSGMLTFFMNQFLISSERVDEQINFLRPEFVRTVEKIKDTAPETQALLNRFGQVVFTSCMGFMSPNTHIELIPSVLDDAPTSLYYIAAVAIINPYSNNIGGAIDLMQHLATYESENAALWDSSLSKPIIRSDYDEKVAQYQNEIARLEAKENRTTQDEDDLDRARRSLAYITEHPYSVSPEDIAYYQNLVQYAYIPGDSPVTFDDALKTLMQRYLNGAFDAEGFARACQDHVNTVYLEMGLTPMYVPN